MFLGIKIAINDLNKQTYFLTNIFIFYYVNGLDVFSFNKLLIFIFIYLELYKFATMQVCEYSSDLFYRIDQ